MVVGGKSNHVAVPHVRVDFKRGSEPFAQVTLLLIVDLQVLGAAMADGSHPVLWYTPHAVAWPAPSLRISHMYPRLSDSL